MSLVAEKVAIAILIRNLVYCSARCKANPKTVAFAGILDAALATLLASLDARNTAANKTLVSSAARDYAAEVLTDMFVPIGLRLAAAYPERRKASGFVRVFGKLRPSDLVTTPQLAQDKVFGDFLLLLQDPETPKALADAVKDFAAAYAVLKTAIAADVAADNALKKAVKTITNARTTALDALAIVEGQLKSLFPRQRKKVDAFFPDNSARRATKQTAAAKAAGFSGVADSGAEDTDPEK